jgi:glycosyltransferase involved in cell wall biosynthesis
MRVNTLVNGVPWFGKYSGYECVRNYFPDGTKVATTFSPDSKLIRALGKSVNLLYNDKLGSIRNDGIWAAYKFLLKSRSYDASHILYADGNMRIFKEFGNSRKNLAGTIHFPISFWKEKNLQYLPYLKNGLILYKEELEAFGQHTDGQKLTFIRHGVDTDFFRPGPANEVNKKKVLFVGAFLRNFDMFLKIYEVISKDISGDFEYHFIVPGKLRDKPAIIKLLSFKNVFFHEKLTDEEMLWHYQTSNLLLMPMDDSGANTAIIQAISTGLPVLTTDVGGIRSYGGGDIFPLVKNNDHLAMVELFNKYCNDEAYRNNVAAKQRAFAVEHMDWRIIANQHIKYYQTAFNLK